MVDFEKMVQDVAWLRKSEKEAADIIKKRRAEFEETIASLLKHHANEKAELQEKEAALRIETVAQFGETGNKKPHPALGIRVTKKLDYDPAWAEGWAREHSPNLMTLDKKRFEKAFKAGVLPEDVLVDEIETPTATIAKDLSAYLEGE